jgi:hypothetical protein
VANIDSTGRPDPMLKIYLPIDVEWVEYKQALKINTHRRWMIGEDGGSASSSKDHGASDRVEDDVGGGDGDDKWVYQRTSPTGAVENVPFHLKNGEDSYNGILPDGNVENEKEWSGGPLVWPVSSFTYPLPTLIPISSQGSPPIPKSLHSLANLFFSL